MSSTSLQSERLIVTDPTDPRIVRNASTWIRIVATLLSSDLIAVVMFCAIGLLVTAALSQIFPSFGEVFESLQQLF